MTDEIEADAEEIEAEPDAVDVWKSGEELEVHRERLPEADAWDRMAAMASKLAKAPTMPRHIRESRDPEADMMVILLTAHDLGLSATVALQKVNVIEGKPAMSAELMRMLVRRDGHRLWVEVEKDGEDRAQAVTWYGVRTDDPDRTHDASFSISDAIDAGLCSLGDDGNIRARSSHGKKLPWEAYTEDMLSARATSRLCRRVFEDCLAGVSYTPEELGTITVEPIDREPVVAQPAVSEARLAQVRQQIKDMSDDEAAIARRLWKERKLGSLTPGGKVPVLRVDEMTAVEQVLADAKREAPADAEVVEPESDAPFRHPFEGADGSDECATCGSPRDIDLHADESAPEAETPDSPLVPAAEPVAAQEPTGDAVAEPAVLDFAQVRQQIEAELKATPPNRLFEALEKAGLVTTGAPKALRARLVEWRVREVEEGRASLTY